MALLKHLPPFLGTKDGICIYMMHGKFRLRTASSLTGKRVKTDPAFAPTMAQASIFARASRIGSQVYRSLPSVRKKKGVIGRLTGEARKLLDDGLTENEIIQCLSI